MGSVRVVSATYIMKCDDDNFVRLESVMAEVKKIPSGKSLYIGNMNYQHKQLRSGKWAVTYEVDFMFDFVMTSYVVFLSVIFGHTLTKMASYSTNIIVGPNIFGARECPQKN